MNRWRRYLKLYLIVFMVISCLGIAFAVYRTNSSVDYSSSEVKIANFPSDDYRVVDNYMTDMETALFGTIEMNVPNGKIPHDIEVVVRDGSLVWSEDRPEIFRANFIVDIEKLQQTYRVQQYFTNRSMSDTSLIDYTTIIICPQEEDLIWESFNCMDFFNS